MKDHPPSAPDSALLTIIDICRIFSIKQRTVHTWVAVGRLPEPIRLSSSVVRWRRKDVEALLGVELKTA